MPHLWFVHIVISRTRRDCSRNPLSSRHRGTAENHEPHDADEGLQARLVSNADYAGNMDTQYFFSKIYGNSRKSPQHWLPHEMK